MPASASRHPARHLLWALPLLTGVAGYSYGLFARPVATPSVAVAFKPTDSVRVAPFAGDPAALFAEVLAATDPPPESSPPQPSVSGLDPAVLKQRLLDLLERHGHLDRDAWAPSDPFRAEYFALAAELGRQQGAAGVAWIEEHLPELRLAAMDAWAKQDPAAAFAAISASDRLNPCDRGTLMELLGKQGGAGPEALLAAIDRVPWHLFTAEDFNDPFAPPGPAFYLPAFSLSASADIRLWVDSGALRHLAAEGIWVPGALGALAKTDAPLAMAEWSARPPSLSELQNSIDFREILTQAAADEAQAASLQKLLTAPGGYAEDPHFREIFTKMITENSGSSAFLRDKFPAVLPGAANSSSKP